MRCFVAVVAMASPPLVGAIQYFKSPGEVSSSVPARCRSALAQNITCSPVLITGSKAANGDYLLRPDLDTYCSTGCSSSINTFRTNVEAGCGNSSYALYPNSTSQQNPKDIAHGIAWAYNLLCIKDETGLCLPDYYDDKKTDCSDCALKYAAVLLSSDYGRARIQPPQFSSLLSSCSAPASKYPWTYTPTAAPSVPTSTSTPATPARTCTGTKYVVKQGDTCESISKANSVATDRMIDVNKLDYGCSTLKVGESLCIQDTCTTMSVRKNQTCASIVKGQPFHIPQLQAWNPTLVSMCDTKLHPNLDSLLGRTLCISPPGGAPIPTHTTTSVASPTKQRPTITSPIFTDWKTSLVIGGFDPANVTTSWYTPTFRSDYSASTSTASLNLDEIRHIEDQRKYCWITTEDERHMYDPDDYPGACQALYTTYCDPDPAQKATPTAPPRVPTVCVPDRSLYNYTGPPPPVVTPVPHQPNMISGCAEFYMVVKGDTCAGVAKKYNIALEDFYKWNPDVGTTCSGLQEGVYVCVAVPKTG